MSPLALLFWIAIFAVAYIYAGYPLLIALAARLSRKQCSDARWDGSVSIVIAGYNEAPRLTAKLRSLLQCEGADRVLEILVGSDGSDDNTPQAVAAVDDPRVRLIHFPERRGKPSVINDLLPMCRGEVVVLTDARQLLESESLSRLLAPFGDPAVGVVSGELKFRQSHDDTSTALGMGAYWKYEKWIRGNESRFRSVPGATGAFYAIRRELFRPIPANTLLDDVVIPMQAVERGYRCLLQEGAIAWDIPSQSTRQEAVRKRRTIAGCAQLILNQPRWLAPWRNPLWWEFVSHKLLRLLSPLLLLTALASNVAVAFTHPAYAWMLALQLSLYVAAAAGWVAARCGRTLPLAAPAQMFVALNVATAAALWDASRGRFRAAWQKT